MDTNVTMEDIKFLKTFATRLKEVHGLNNTDEVRRFEEIVNKLYHLTMREGIST